MKKLTRSELMQVSVLLFGMFFGAGNLIFPPLLGNQAGASSFIALAAFSITAVVFPVLGVIAVGKTDGIDNLGNRVGKKFSLIFTTAIYLSIGPGLAIPRAGTVPFEMSVAPYVPESFSLPLARFIYTFIFFSLALWLCLKPNKMVKRVGKYLTPALLIMLVVMFVRIIFLPHNVVGPVGDYQTTPVVTGFLSGYETMDAIAALNFGFVIAMAVRQFGVEDEKEVTKYTFKAGILAGLLLFLVYAMLSSIGMVTSGFFPGAENGAVILSKSMDMALGSFGLVFLAGIFTLACLTTCVGLITSGGEYFHHLFHEKLSYRAWVVIWTGFSFLMANVGLNKLLAFSVPVLTVIYPVALVLILMGISHDLVGYRREAYVLGAFVSVALPVIDTLDKSFKISLPLVTGLEKSLPLAAEGLSWLLPSLIVVVAVTVVDKAVSSYRVYQKANESAQ